MNKSVGNIIHPPSAVATLGHTPKGEPVVIGWDATEERLQWLMGKYRRCV